MKFSRTAIQDHIETKIKDITSKRDAKLQQAKKYELLKKIYSKTCEVVPSVVEKGEPIELTSHASGKKQLEPDIREILSKASVKLCREANLLNKQIRTLKNISSLNWDRRRNPRSNDSTQFCSQLFPDKSTAELHLLFLNSLVKQGLMPQMSYGIVSSRIQKGSFRLVINLALPMQPNTDKSAAPVIFSNIYREMQTHTPPVESTGSRKRLRN